MVHQSIGKIKYDLTNDERISKKIKSIYASKDIKKGKNFQ